MAQMLATNTEYREKRNGGKTPLHFLCSVFHTPLSAASPNSFVFLPNSGL